MRILITVLALSMLPASPSRADGVSQQPAAATAASPTQDEPAPLAELGLRASTGAAAGYVPDRACGFCHRDLAESYREVGMARSFYRPRAADRIETLDGPAFYHAASERYYEMRWRDEGLVFRRYRKDDDGEITALFERRVDWILGSGHTSRSYIFQTEAGELYQLPLAWYSQTGRWGMAPGYDKADHQGVTRRVRRECMFCHNGYPEVPAGADLPWAPQGFPADLPEGTGCQRCHGPGAEHARIASKGAATPEERRALGATIVNPGRLPPLERDSVCMQCHLQPSVAFSGVRRFSRADYSFRPGEPLADYILPVDPEEADRGRHERFEINHHPYRLMQSACWRESRGQLSCLSCHDPHRKVGPEERASHYRAACESCHGADACGRERHSVAEDAPGGSGARDRHGSPAGDTADCVSCHMPRRRTEDVVEVAMTDHFIRRRPPSADLLAPLAERDPVIRSVELFPLVGGPEGAEAALYRAVAAVRANPTPRTVNRLGALLDASQPAELAPWLDFARGLLQLGRLKKVQKTAEALLERAPDLALAHEWLGLSLAGQGRLAEAAAALRRSLALDEQRPESHFNLALVLLEGRPEEAARHLERAVELRPVLVEGWYRLADAYARLDNGSGAIAALRRALAVDPDHAAAAAALRLFERDTGPGTPGAGEG